MEQLFSRDLFLEEAQKTVEKNKKEIETLTEELGSFYEKNEIPITIISAAGPKTAEVAETLRLQAKIDSIKDLSPKKRELLEAFISYGKSPIVVQRADKNSNIKMLESRAKARFELTSNDARLKRLYDFFLSSRYRGDAVHGRRLYYDPDDTAISAETRKLAEPVEKMFPPKQLGQKAEKTYDDLTDSEQIEFHTKIFPPFVLSLAKDLIAKAAVEAQNKHPNA
jgi:hypothetical protein